MPEIVAFKLKDIDTGVENIRYLGAYKTLDEFGIKTSISKRIFSYIVGIDGMAIFQPLGIWADDGLILITEPSLKEVILINTNKNRIKKMDGEFYPVDAIFFHKKIFISDANKGEVLIYSDAFKKKGRIEKKFIRPVGLCFSEVIDKIFIVDTWAHKVYSFNSSGNMEMEIGRRGGGDGEFNFPIFCATNRGTILYVVDSMNIRVQYFNAITGEYIGKFGCHSENSGCMANPKGIAVDSSGNIYVSDSLFDVVQVFKNDGSLLAIIGKRGQKEMEFWSPADIHIDKNDRIFIADMFNNRIQVFQYYPVGVTTQ